jgi:Homeodomain-like domain
VNKKYVVTLTDPERELLEQMLSKGKAAARSLLHAWILLKADASPAGPAWTDDCIRQTFAVSPVTIYRVRQRFVEEGFQNALAHKRPCRSRHRKLDGDQEARLIALACTSPPAGRRRWTLRLLASKFVDLGHSDPVSPETIRQVLKKTN